MAGKPRRKKRKQPTALGRWGMKLAGLLAASTVRMWMSTLDFKGAMYDPSVDPVEPSWRGQKIYIFWHENILAPLYLRGHCNLAMLLSRHRDADILLEGARHLGFEFVRGSTFGGGATALRELERKGRHMNLAITPDGPRGPRRVLAQGPIYLSSKLGMPIVAMGFGYDKPWRMPTWDQFAVPKPYSRACGVISPAIVIPPNLDREGMEHYRVKVERLLNRLTLEAEAWAHSRTPKVGEFVPRPQPAWSKLHPEVTQPIPSHHLAQATNGSSDVTTNSRSSMVDSLRRF
jgi:lysophospholipid acyltransferase (LPLAT)-like uncharacterized protein